MSCKFLLIKLSVRQQWYFQISDNCSNTLSAYHKYEKIVSGTMFNTSNHSSERSMRHGSTRSQRGPSTQKSRSDRSPNSSRHSESFRSHIPQPPQRKIPEWVHCEKCFVSHDVNPKMRLLTCLHILCHTCLRINDCNSFIYLKKCEEYFRMIFVFFQLNL